MNTKKDIIVLRSLLHDIGKFMERAKISYPHEQFDNAEEQVTAFTAKQYVPVPPIQWIIDQAERLAAGIPECKESEIGGKEESLYPIVETVALEQEGSRTVRHRLGANPLSLEKGVIFPHLKEGEDASLADRYRFLWDGFEKEFGRLPRKNISVFTETLVYLLEKYTWCIPGPITDMPDVSLFDHSKTTAAIAACLYDYHECHGTLNEEAVRELKEKKYLLVCGDISGIQTFIYNITNKGAAKGLKGRSFLIQLFSEAAGNYILRTSDYPVTNMLYSGGGRFYLLLANRYEHELENIRTAINTNLLKDYNGEVYLALGWCKLRGEDFGRENFPEKWRAAAGSTNEDKRRKFAGLEYARIFGPLGTGGNAATCQICKKEDKLTTRLRDGVKLCENCKTAEDLGQKLSRAEYLVEVYRESKRLKGGFDTPIPHIRYYLLDKPDEAVKIDAERVVVYRLNHTGFLPENMGANAFGFKFAGGAGQGKTLMFGDLTERSTGLKRLGVLRMDVDNLGRIFSEGLGRGASLSRVAGLSHQLSLFFGGYLNEICRKDKYCEDTLIIYSGGDDLFIVGAWDKVIELAPDIRQAFREFTCHNPSFTLSGGIIMSPEKYAIYRSASHAEEAEKKAKMFKRRVNGQDMEKDALTFLGKSLGWNDLDVCQEIKETFYPLLKEGREGKKLPAGILNRLKEIYLLYEENRRYWHEKGLCGAELEDKAMNHKWKWRGVYTLSRAARQNPLFKEDICKIRSALLGDQINSKKSEQPLIKFIDVPVRWTEFLIRRERG